jgi:hypothetical protein
VRVALIFWTLCASLFKQEKKVLFPNIAHQRNVSYTYHVFYHTLLVEIAYFRNGNIYNFVGAVSLSGAFTVRTICFFDTPFGRSRVGRRRAHAEKYAQKFQQQFSPLVDTKI